MEKRYKDLASGSVCIHDETIYFAGEGYFDGCNWSICQEDGSLLETLIECTEYEDKKNSW